MFLFNVIGCLSAAGVLFLLVSDRNIRSVGLGYPHWRKEDVLCLSQSAKQGFAGLGNGEHCNGSILSALPSPQPGARREKEKGDAILERDVHTSPTRPSAPALCPRPPLPVRRGFDLIPLYSTLPPRPGRPTLAAHM